MGESDTLNDLLKDDKEKVTVESSIILEKAEGGEGIKEVIIDPTEPVKAEVVKAEVVKSEIKTSKPWSANDNPWSPDIFKVPKIPGFRLRFVSENKVDQRKSQGWTPVEQNELTGLISTHSIDTTFRARRMLLMKMPEEMAKKREKFFSDLTDRRSKTAETEDIKKDVGKIEDDMGEDQSFRLSIKRKSRRGYL